MSTALALLQIVDLGNLFLQFRIAATLITISWTGAEMQILKQQASNDLFSPPLYPHHSFRQPLNFPALMKRVQINYMNPLKNFQANYAQNRGRVVFRGRRVRVKKYIERKCSWLSLVKFFLPYFFIEYCWRHKGFVCLWHRIDRMLLETQIRVLINCH